MNLVIDIGNSFIKTYVFESNEIVHFQTDKVGGQIRNFEDFLNLEQAIISTVGDISEALFTMVQSKTKKIIVLDHNTPIPIQNFYKTPETLGKDRLAGIVGAYNIYKSQNVLAIDAGTALTFDIINRHAEYLGGNISPGLEMRYKALNYFTNKLPLVEKQEDVKLFGSSTFEAISSGVQNGIVYEIDAFIDKVKTEFEDLKIILTGGDTFFFAHKLKNTIFAEPNLVAIGLNYILQYNVEKSN